MQTTAKRVVVVTGKARKNSSGFETFWKPGQGWTREDLQQVVRQRLSLAEEPHLGLQNRIKSRPLGRSLGGFGVVFCADDEGDKSWN